MIVFLLYAIACIKWGNWKRWKEFYPTILYTIIGNLTYGILFSNRMLWTYDNLLNHTFGDMFYTFFVFPSAVILFLTFYPSGLVKQGLYILIWTAVNTAVEYAGLLLRTFSHYYGWNIFWSAGLYFFAFILIALHTKHPLLVWPISLGFALLTMLIFQQPIFGT